MIFCRTQLQIYYSTYDAKVEPGQVLTRGPSHWHRVRHKAGAVGCGKLWTHSWVSHDVSMEATTNRQLKILSYMLSQLIKSASADVTDMLNHCYCPVFNANIIVLIFTNITLLDCTVPVVLICCTVFML